MKAAALVVAVLAGAAQAQTGPHFIHGSWVNVREAASPTARAVEQLTTNTPVDVTSRQGDWCQLKYGTGKFGFVACNLLGPKPLTLAEAGSNAARAFWVAPSPNRLVAYGQSLPVPPALRLPVLQKTLKIGDTVRFPAVPEFEAAKQRMKAGVVLDPSLEVMRGEPANLAAVLKAYKLRPAPIKPSLFRTHDSVALISEQDADGLAAVARSKVVLTPDGLPTAWFARHSGPEIEGLTGFWDVGHAELTFDPPLPLYTVGANGLVGAQALRKVPFDVGGEGHYCGAFFPGRSPEWTMNLQFGAADDRLDVTPMRGYPALKSGSEGLVTLVVPKDKPLQSARVKVRSEPLKRIADINDEADEARFKALKPQVVLREIDLDGDGVADVLQVEEPGALGHVSLNLVITRTWFVNINGQWFRAGTLQDEDCT